MNALRLITTFLISIVLFSCNHSPQKAENLSSSEAVANTTRFSNPLVFFKKFQGKTSENKIVFIYFIRNGNSNEGDSVLHIVIDYSNNDVPQSYVGTISNDGAIKCSSYNYLLKKESAILNGIFSSESTINATLYYPNLNNQINVDFVESDLDLRVFPSNYYNQGISIQTDPDLQGGLCDSFLSYIDINTLAFKSSNKSVKKLNKIVDASVNFEKSIREKMLPIMNTESHSTSILFCEKNIVTIELLSQLYFCGAAHGSYGVSYINFDLERGDTISLLEIIPSEMIGKLKSICKQKFKRKYQRSDDELIDFQLTSNYALLSSGLLFKYQPYEMGSFAEGAMEIFIPYNEIYGIINVNNSIVKRLTKK